jgi:hypothetical protein
MRFAHIAALSGVASLTYALKDGSAAPGNWSVQLMNDLRPEEVTEAHWNVAVDTMITKSEAYVTSPSPTHKCADKLIEN